jgi:hypothetical protein
VYKVFPTLMNCATGSRLAYQSTAPLCAFLAYGLAKIKPTSKLIYLARIVTVIVIFLSAQILYSNNLAWAEAGAWTNNIVNQLRNFYKENPGDPFVYITGLPTTTSKNIFALGVLGQVTKKPIMDRDINNCARLDSNEQNVNLGFLKQAASDNKTQMHLLYWDSSLEKLLPVVIPPPNTIFPHKWQGNSLKQMVRVFPLPSMPTPELRWLNDDTLELISHTSSPSFTALEFDLPNIPCWYVDYLVLKAQFIHQKDFGIFGQAQLRFTNNIAKNYSKTFSSFNSSTSPVSPSKNFQDITFSLRNLPSWNMGNTCSSVRIILPIQNSIKISEISIPKTESIIPKVYLNQSKNDPPGLLNLNSKNHKSQNIRYDASALKNADHAVLEVIPTSSSFEHLNTNIDKITLLKTSSGNTGQFIIYRKELPLDINTYIARIKMLNTLNNQIAFPSDNFFLNVQP